LKVQEVTATSKPSCLSTFMPKFSWNSQDFSKEISSKKNIFLWKNSIFYTCIFSWIDTSFRERIYIYIYIHVFINKIHFHKTYNIFFNENICLLMKRCKYKNLLGNAMPFFFFLWRISPYQKSAESAFVFIIWLYGLSSILIENI